MKQRQDSVEGFEKGGRPELAAKEREEIEVLNAYLPKQLPPEELAAIVPAWNERQLTIIGSPLGYYGGVLGAAAVAMEKLFC